MFMISIYFFLSLTLLRSFRLGFSRMLIPARAYVFSTNFTLLWHKYDFSFVLLYIKNIKHKPCVYNVAVVGKLDLIDDYTTSFERRVELEIARSNKTYVANSFCHFFLLQFCFHRYAAANSAKKG